MTRLVLITLASIALSSLTVAQESTALPPDLEAKVEAQEHLARGTQAFNRQDFAATIDHLSQFVALDDQNGSAYHQLGFALIVNAQEEKALKGFQRQLALGWRPGIATYNSACSLARLGETDAAFDWLEKALTHGFGDVNLARTDTDLDSLRNDQRMQRFIEGVATAARLRNELTPKIPAQDWAGAAEIAEKLVAIASHDGNALLSLGQARLGLGRYEEAAEAFARQAATSVQPNIAWRGLIYSRAQSEDFDAALAKLRAEPARWKTSENVPALEATLQRLRKTELVPVGRAALAERDFDRAGEVYAELTKIDASDGMSWLGMGLVHYQQGRTEKALAAFQRQLKTGAAFDTGLHWTARCLVRLGKMEEAIAYLAAARRVGVSGEVLRTDADLAPLASHTAWAKLTSEG